MQVAELIYIRENFLLIIYLRKSTKSGAYTLNSSVATADDQGLVICGNLCNLWPTTSHFGDSNSRPVVYETTALTD
jgi:hypothetical protein